MIPVLETERLVLRGWKPEDFGAYAQFMADPDVMRYLGGMPMTREDAWRSFATIVGHWVLRGYGLWAVARKSDGALVGRVGLWRPEGWPGLEVGWTLGKDYWGQRYATEAAQAALDYAFLTQAPDRMISVIDAGNVASQNVAARIGETRGGSTEISHNGKTFAVDVWSISRKDWQAQRGAR